MKIRIGLAVSVLVIALLIFVKTAVKVEDVVKALNIVTLRGPLVLVRPETQVSWPLSMPDQQGIDGEKLRQLSSALVSQNTAALLLLRNGFLLHEWYEPDRAVEDRYSLAAATKGAVAGLLVMLAVEEGWVQLS